MSGYKNPIHHPIWSFVFSSSFHKMLYTDILCKQNGKINWWQNWGKILMPFINFKWFLNLNRWELGESKKSSACYLNSYLVFAFLFLLIFLYCLLVFRTPELLRFLSLRYAVCFKVLKVSKDKNARQVLSVYTSNNLITCIFASSPWNFICSIPCKQTEN